MATRNVHLMRVGLEKETKTLRAGRNAGREILKDQRRGWKRGRMATDKEEESYGTTKKAREAAKDTRNKGKKMQKGKEKGRKKGRTKEGRKEGKRLARSKNAAIASGIQWHERSFSKTPQ